MMNYLSNREPRIPTKLKAAISDLLVSYELQAARAAMGHKDTKEEKLFSEFLDIVKKAKPQQLKAVKERMTISKDQLKAEKRFKNFSKFDLSQKAPLPDLDFKKLHGSYIKDLSKRWVHIPAEVPGAGHLDLKNFNFPQNRYKGVRFYLREVKCFDETGPNASWSNAWLGEAGEDEIYMGGGSIDETGDVKTVKYFKVGNFDDGDRKVYPGKGKELQYFNIREGGNVFPKIYTLAIPFIEHDFESLSRWYNKFLKELGDFVEDKIIELIASGIGASIGSLGGPLGSLAGLVVGWAVGKAIEIVKGWLDNDHLGTATITATINSYSGNWVGTGTHISPTFYRDFRGNRSHYRMYWYCELVS